LKKADMFELTPQQIDLFKAQDFENQPPGTILRDFSALLNLIDHKGMPLTPSCLIAMNRLETINLNLSHPIELRLKRTPQKSYPNINGLYLLLRATGIGVIDTQGKKPLLKLDPSVLDSWQSLNGAERYFTLLKAWWGRATEEIIGARYAPGADILHLILGFFRDFPKTGEQTIKKPLDDFSLRYRPAFYNLALLELFGLLEVRVMPPAEGRGWIPQQLRMTDWGKVLLGSYSNFISKAFRQESESALSMLGFSVLDDPLQGFEKWSQSFRPFIPTWRKELVIPELGFQPGPHVFKISLGGQCWRRIAIPGDAFFAEFAAMILNAFDFDHDHLYCFSYKDRFGRTIEIDHTYMAGDSDNVLASEARIGDIPLVNGMHIGFLFDFGDQWEFDIQAEDVNADLTIKKAKILDKHGKAPEQYGYGDW
jgi:hypothetical protein